MNKFVMPWNRNKETTSAICVAVEDVSPVQKSLNYGSLFSHGLPMELLFKQVLQPYANIPSVYKPVKAICDNVPQAELKIFNLNEEEVTDERLSMLIKRPNTKQSFNDFLQEWTGNYSLYGEGFIKKIIGVAQMAGIANLPANLKNLDPTKVKEIVDQATQELVGWRYGTMEIKLEEVLHTKDFNPYNLYRGLSPLKPIQDELIMDEATVRFNNAFFKNNASLGLILGTDQALTKEQRDALRAVIEARGR
jgi:HK97 family phage portal protein